MSEIKNRPPPLHIKRIKGELVKQHHKHDNQHDPVNLFANLIKNLTSPEKTTKQNNYESSESNNNKKADRNELLLNSRESQGSPGFKLIKIQCLDQNNHHNKNSSKGSATSFRTSNKHKQKKLINQMQGKQTLKKIISFQKEQNQQQTNELIFNKQTFQQSMQVQNIKQLLSNQIIPIENKQHQLLTNNQNIPSILPVDSIIKVHPSEQNEIVSDTKNQQRKLARNSQKWNYNHNFTTHKKKPSQNQKQSPVLTDNRIKNKPTKQWLMSPATKSSRKNNESEGGGNFILKLLQSFQTPNQKQLNKNQSLQPENDMGLQSPSSIVKLVVNLENSKSKQQLQKLKNVMKNQQNLKLKDYLRLASLSKDSKFDRYSKSLNKKPMTSSNSNLLNVKHMQNDNELVMKRSYLFNKNRTAIDSQKSIALIKASLHKKLQKIIQTSLKVFSQIEENKDLIGNQYEDLVFMCNFHKVFDENMFKATDLLEDLLKQYEDKSNKCKIINKIAQKQEVTENQMMELMSPRKKSKKSDTLDIGELLRNLLFGFNIIKQSDANSDKIKQN